MSIEPGTPPQSSAECWTILKELGELWGRSEVAVAFKAHLPRHSPGGPSTELAKHLQELNASGARVSSIPLTAWSWTTMFLSDPALSVAATPPPLELEGWLKHAFNLEQAGRLTLAWIRARLPGYPMIPAPQLGRGTQLTTEEFTTKFVWRRNDVTRQLQLTGPPDVLVDMLRPPAGDERPLLELTARLLDAMQRTPTWGAFEQASKVLGAAARSELKAAKGMVGKLLSAEAVDAHEPSLAHPRNASRAKQLRSVIDGLSDEARAYAQAFDDVGEFIDRSVVEVLGQLMAFGEPMEINDALEVETDADNLNTVSFTTEQMIHIPGGLVNLTHPLIRETLIVEGISMRMSGQEFRTELRAVRLPGSG